MLYLLQHDHLFLVLSIFFVRPTFLGRKNPCPAARFFQALASWKCKLNGSSKEGSIHISWWSWICLLRGLLTIQKYLFIECLHRLLVTLIGQQEKWRKTICNNKANHMCWTPGLPTCDMPLQRLVRIPSWLPAAASAVLERHINKSNMICWFQKWYVEFFHCASACLSIGMLNNFHSHLAWQVGTLSSTAMVRKSPSQETILDHFAGGTPRELIALPPEGINAMKTMYYAS